MSIWSMQPVQASKNDPSQGPLAFMRAGEMNFVLGCEEFMRGIKSVAEGPASSVRVRFSNEKSGSLKSSIYGGGLFASIVFAVSM